jgi:hypothetical protein
MDEDNKKILQYQAAKIIGRAVSEWMKKNAIEEDVTISAVVTHPTLYVDELGVSHTGPLTLIDVDIEEEDNDDDDY